MSANAVPALAIEGVAKSFGGLKVLDGVSFDLAPGRTLAVVGESGCGKSTMLNMTAGLEDVTSGEIRINGKVVNQLGPFERDVAMVFQNYALYPHMTVAENIAIQRDVGSFCPCWQTLTPPQPIVLRIQPSSGNRPHQSLQFGGLQWVPHGIELPGMACHQQLSTFLNIPL